MNIIYLLKTCEINLKGENKSIFEKQLFANIRKQLNGIKVKISGRKGRFFLKPVDNVNDETRAKIEKTLASVFGLTGYSVARIVEKDIEEIGKTVLEVVSKQFDDCEAPMPQTFKITSRRSDKSFKYSSYELSCILGKLVLDNFKTLKVNLKNPDFKINIEIRDKAVVYSHVYKSPGGLPSGIAGKGILLLSGGIDSPVAGYMMAKRGCAIDALHFETYPYTSEQSKEKVIEIAKKIRVYLPKMKLYIFPFTEIQVHIKQNCKQEEITLFSRAAMMKIASLLAEKTRANSIITGESLNQVASQTAENIRFTGSHTTYPLFRPLIGMDKQEIITKAKEIGSYDISILPYPDCCSVFAPAHPILKPLFEKVTASFKAIELDAFIENAFAKIEVLKI
ncbi:MAG: tRNA 4-thiouridine(8) synthase ThiI [Spirochaetaceae bacterium]|nr:tRNA 4-thiouridine(8) synthase ThiI [Spirochaetaceae bacterium]